MEDRKEGFNLAEKMKQIFCYTALLRRFLIEGFYPFPGSYFSIYLALNFLNQIFLIPWVCKHLAVAGLACKYCGLDRKGRIIIATFRIYKHGIALRAKSPNIMGVISNV